MNRREYKAIAYEYDLVSRILLCLIYAANIVIFIYITNFHYFFLIPFSLPKLSA